MQNHSTKTIGIVIFFLSILFVVVTYGEELSGVEIFKKAFELYDGIDSISKLTFTFQEEKEPERKIISTRVWKDFKGKDGVDSKVILFNEYPPDSKGSAFMSWIYKPELNKKDDMWLYIPTLRKVRKLSERDEEDFAGSELKTPDLVPRYPNLDEHTLLKTETIRGVDYYVIESKPKTNTESYPYSKTIRWISKTDLTTIRIDYYDLDGDLQKRQFIKWKQIKNAWVWEKVMAKNVQNGNSTILDLTDIKIDTGIKDEMFSERTMELGVDSLK